VLDEVLDPLPLAARGLPESELLPDADAARAVKEKLKINRRVDLGWSALLAWPPVVIIIGVGVLVIVDQLLTSIAHHMPPIIASLATLLIPLGVAVGLGTLLQRRVAGLAVREVLLERGIPVCRGCGYHLADLPAGEPRCPECGRERDDPGLTARPQSSVRSESHTV
jgi:hypothetical protein